MRLRAIARTAFRVAAGCNAERYRFLALGALRARLLLLGTLAFVACGGASAPGAAPPALTQSAAEPDSSVALADPEDETAQLWVTRDRGARVMLTATVPAGLTVMQALDREAEIETRYGGRYVQSIDGVVGSVERQADWFYFVNGIEPDVGAAEVRLRPGDVAWWDFRSWEGEPEAPIVVGAFPEPFLHGFDGNSRPAEVQAPAELADVAAQLEQLLSPAAASGEPNVFVLELRPGNVAEATLTATRGASNDSPVRFVLSGTLEAVSNAAAALASTPEIVRYRYSAVFDASGRLRE
jgi:hypothetical protein